MQRAIKQATSKTITINNKQTLYFVTKNVVTTKDGIAKAQKQIELTKKILDKGVKNGFRYFEEF